MMIAEIAATSPLNRVEVGISPHLHAELPRRAAWVSAVREDREPNRFRPLSFAPPAEWSDDGTFAYEAAEAAMSCVAGEDAAGLGALDQAEALLQHLGRRAAIAGIDEARLLAGHAGLGLLGRHLGLAVGLDHEQHRANRDHIADLASDRRDNTRHRTFDINRRLVGHHVDQVLVFLDPVADLDVPFDDFRLGHAFAHVGHLENESRHGAGQSLRSLSMASPMRTGPGK